jgi:hypothetical protein
MGCREVFKAEFTGRFHITSVSECEPAVQEPQLMNRLDDVRAKPKLTRERKAPRLACPSSVC